MQEMTTPELRKVLARLKGELDHTSERIRIGEKMLAEASAHRDKVNREWEDVVAELGQRGKRILWPDD